MNLLSQIESILFVASKPLHLSTIAKAVGKNEMEVEDALETLKMKYNREESGIHILHENREVQMATNAVNGSVIEGFVKDEMSGELTKAQLETLTVIAYREPVTRPELEQIRGVNCALILRNLAMRGLVQEIDDKEKLTPVYYISFDALRHLGVVSVNNLPNYEELHKHQHIENVLENEV